MELRRQSSGFLDRFSNLPWNCIVKHVPNVRNQPENTMRNLVVEAAGLLAIDDTVLRTRHDNNWQCQFLIAVLQRMALGIMATPS
jgi:hypothetical protein